jgi:hypothetical protein
MICPPERNVWWSCYEEKTDIWTQPCLPQNKSRFIYECYSRHFFVTTCYATIRASEKSRYLECVNRFVKTSSSAFFETLSCIPDRTSLDPVLSHSYPVRSLTFCFSKNQFMFRLTFTSRPHFFPIFRLKFRMHFSYPNNSYTSFALPSSVLITLVFISIL